MLSFIWIWNKILIHYCILLDLLCELSCVLICCYLIQVHASCPAYRFVTVTIVYNDIWRFRLLENDKVQSVRPAEQNCKLEEIKTRLNPGNASYYLVQNFSLSIRYIECHVLCRYFPDNWELWAMRCREGGGGHPFLSVLFNGSCECNIVLMINEWVWSIAGMILTIKLKYWE